MVEKRYHLSEEELQRAIDLAHAHGQLTNAAFIRKIIKDILKIIKDILDEKVTGPSAEVERYVLEQKRRQETRGALWKLLARVARALLGIG